MTIESATYIDGLNASNPGPTDLKSEGDDHIRLIKSTVKTTFPNVTGAVTKTHTELNNTLSADGSGNVGVGGSYIAGSAAGGLSVNNATSVNVNLGIGGTLTGSIKADAGEVLISASGAIPIVFLTNSVERMRIAGDGTVTFTGSVLASIPWTSVTGKPSNISYFSNDSGYQTTSGTVTNLSGGSVNATTITGSGNIQTTGGHVFAAGLLYGHSASGGTGLGRITTTTVTGTPAGTNVGDMVLVY